MGEAGDFCQDNRIECGDAMPYRKRKLALNRSRSLRIAVEPLESRLLLAADVQLPEVHDLAPPESEISSDIDQRGPDTRGQKVNFGSPQLLPGDAAVGAADGHQVEPQIAQGGNQYLAVWIDYRASCWRMRPTNS